MSFMPSEGSQVRLKDGRSGTVIRVTPPGTGDVVLLHGTDKCVAVTAWDIEQVYLTFPKLDRKTRWSVRRIFLMGLLHPDAMHYAIWGRWQHETEEDALARLREYRDRSNATADIDRT